MAKQRRVGCKRPVGMGLGQGDAPGWGLPCSSEWGPSWWYPPAPEAPQHFGNAPKASVIPVLPAAGICWPPTQRLCELQTLRVAPAPIPFSSLPPPAHPAASQHDAQRRSVPPPTPSPPNFGGRDPSLWLFFPPAPLCSPPREAGAGSQDLDSITFFAFSLIEGYISIVMDAETQKR